MTKPASRRAAVAGAVLMSPALLSPAHALKPCPSGANNCFSSASAADKTKLAEWRYPAGASKADVVKDLRAVIQGYPQAGQAQVDLGGWKVAEDSLADKGYARVEYLSGLGNMAKFFNGGQPFVDDLELEIQESAVAVRSSSRVGDSDFGVNAARLRYLAAALREKGWAAEAPSAGLK